MIKKINAKNIMMAQDILLKSKSVNNDQFVIEIHDVIDTKISVESYDFTDYIDCFIDKNKLDNLWKCDNDWYLSYSRRLFRKINNIDVMTYLKKIIDDDIDSRRCLISTFVDDDFINQNYPALSLVQFMVRNNKLEMYTYWRSQEATIAFALNTLCMLSYQRIFYKMLSLNHQNLKLGKYISYVSNMQFEDFSNFSEKDKLKKFKFYCSIVDKGEKEYDENYKR